MQHEIENDQVRNRDLRDRWVTFRVNGQELDDLQNCIHGTRLSRSAFIRNILATGGVVYLGSEFVDALVSYRADMVRAGNLIKLTEKYLQLVAENPLLAEDQRDRLSDARKDLQTAAGDILQTHRKLVETLEKFNADLEALNRGDL